MLVFATSNMRFTKNCMASPGGEQSTLINNSTPRECENQPPASAMHQSISATQRKKKVRTYSNIFLGRNSKPTNKAILGNKFIEQLSV
jgi:hypothetical protein